MRGIAVICEPSPDALATGKIGFHDSAESHAVDGVRLALFEVG